MKLREGAFIILGTTVYSGGVYLFTAPNQIAPGGVMGLATALHDLIGVPIGTFTAAVNLPLLLIGTRHLGRKFLWRTLFSTLLVTLLLDWVFPFFLPVYQGNLILAAVYGGAMIGAGMGLVFLQDGSTGGMDIVNQLLRRRFPQIPLGKFVLGSDLVVIVIAALVYRNAETALYAAMTVYISSHLLDTVLYGWKTGKLAFIVSRHSTEIAHAIGSQMRRGATLLAGKGSYSGQHQWMILCACRSREVVRLKQLIRRIDPKAFCVVTQASEVLGEGFEPFPLL